MNQALPTLFALTLFLASALLFSVQPMIARTVLPLLGGSPSGLDDVHVVLPAALLAGYGYAHATTSWLGTRRQVVLHGLLLASAFFFLPLGAPAVLGVESHPTAGLLGWLTRSAGLPFFTVATTAPLLQRWFAASGHPRARDPYFLYAASNAGSLAALIAYPLWIERRLGLGAQSMAWSVGLMMLVLLVAGCAAVTILRVRSRGPEDERVEDPPATLRRSSWPGWIILALIPSSLMLGVTTLFDDRPGTDPPAVGRAAGALPALVHRGFQPPLGVVCPRVEEDAADPAHGASAGDGGRPGAALLDPAPPFHLLRGRSGLPR